MEDLAEMCHTIRSRARMAVAKVSVSPHSEDSTSDYYTCNNGFSFPDKRIPGIVFQLPLPLD